MHKFLLDSQCLNSLFIRRIFVRLCGMIIRGSLSLVFLAVVSTVHADQLHTSQASDISEQGEISNSSAVQSHIQNASDNPFPINTLRQLGPGVWQESGVAIMGYDPVSYFLNHRAEKGSKQYQLHWRGATWLFTTASNREIFNDNPEAFAPQYGGYSAHGVANGYLVKIDPNSWAVVEGKLYLNYKEKFHRHWLNDSVNLIDLADQHYMDLVSDPMNASIRSLSLTADEQDADIS